MARAIGTPKTGGRKVGTPNKRTQQFQVMLDGFDLCPGEEMVFIYREQIKIFQMFKKEKDYDGAVLALRDAARTVGNLCEYTYPKKKAIEHKTEVGKTFADFVAAAHGLDSSSAGE